VKDSLKKAQALAGVISRIIGGLRAELQRKKESKQ